MTPSDDNSKSSIYHDFLNLLYRAIPATTAVYVFFKLIITQADVFLDARLFAVAWITVYLVCALAQIFCGYVFRARGLSSYWFCVCVRWPFPVAAVGVVTFYIGPYFLPFIHLL